jgi:cyclopropane-fatty-acyl-phospholipid synthase
MLRVPMYIGQKLFPRANTVESAKENARFHYDTSNELFMSFLSEDMCYSCPIFVNPEDSLAVSQRNKVHRILQRAEIGPGHHILDIGGGWGFLAIEAVRLTGCRVTVVTLSEEQKELAEKRVRENVYQDRIRFLLCDYRKTPRPPGGFDRIVSVEMIEAVGQDFLNVYFQALRDLLSPEGGRIVIQAITFTEKVHFTPLSISWYNNDDWLLMF